MKKIMILVALGAGLVAAAKTEAPSLDQTIGIGAGVGGQHYNGTFGDHTDYLYYRGFVKYNPLEWAGARLTLGGGNIGSEGYETEWFSNLGLDLVLQPKIELLGSFRPYVASGVSTTFGTSKVDGSVNEDLDWNFYAPVELGLEYLINKNWSAWAWGETYLHMDKWDRLDGVVTGSDNYLDKRDDLYKAGLGITFRFGVKLDADKDLVPDALDKCPNTPAGVKVDVTGCPLDEDKDGVADYKDKCPATAREAKVDSLGCALDTDKDGVADHLDKCSSTPAGVKIDAAGCPVDSDKDGVADYLDKCANTMVGARVDAAGCPTDADKDGVADAADKCANTPVGVRVDATGCPLDTDKDGVPDHMDKCSKTPAKAAVGLDGCPLDTDKDGVFDYADQCPGTKAGDKIDSTGCTIIVIEKGAKLTLDGIVFKSGSAEIDISSAPTLARAAAALAKAPDAKVEIAGFTDNVGRAATNKKLSQKRAEAVRKYLIEAGTPAPQLTAVGYGAAQPVGDNKTEEGRLQNRRIEFRVK